MALKTPAISLKPSSTSVSAKPGYMVVCSWFYPMAEALGLAVVSPMTPDG